MKEYKPGTRIELIEMVDDPYPLPSGSKGTITYRDSLGDYGVKWDCGSGLKLISGIDKWKEIEP